MSLPTINPYPLGYAHPLQSIMCHNDYDFSDDNESWGDYITSILADPQRYIMSPSPLPDDNDDNESSIIHSSPNNNHHQQQQQQQQHHLVTGGSSSGSAASVCHGSSLLSICSDTGGSIRLPAAWTGIVGMRPSYGSISRYGLIPYVSSMDTIGVMGSSVGCVALGMDCLVNRDYSSKEDDRNDSSIDIGGGNQQKQIEEEQRRNYHRRSTTKDATAVFFPADANFDPDVSSPSKSLSSSTSSSTTRQNIRIGIPSAFAVSELTPEAQQAWSIAASILQDNNNNNNSPNNSNDNDNDNDDDNQKHSCIDTTVVNIPTSILPISTVSLALPAYYILACAECSSNMSRYDGIRYGNNGGSSSPGGSSSYNGNDEGINVPSLRSRTLGREVVRRILCGTAVLSSDKIESHYLAAEKVRNDVASAMQAVFRNVTNNKYDDDKNDANVEILSEEGWEGVDILLLPTAVRGPPVLSLSGTNDKEDKNNDDYLMEFADDLMTVPASLAGLPALSVPIPISISKGKDTTGTTTTFGIQIIGRAMSDDMVLRVARELEKALMN